MEAVFDESCDVMRVGAGTADSWNDGDGSLSSAASGVLCRRMRGKGAGVSAPGVSVAAPGGADLERAEWRVYFPIGTDVRGKDVLVFSGARLEVQEVDRNVAMRDMFVGAGCREVRG